jgi:DNA gyrase subunit A
MSLDVNNDQQNNDLLAFKNNSQGCSIVEEMEKSYLDYAMSVIVSRALPDVRDGLKPVHRRILYSMYETGCHSDKPYRKSARTVGDVMGKYHPHGDQAIYDALVRMGQDFSMSIKLIDGQGNFGSVDKDDPAAMRYTEARLAKVSHTLLNDLDKDTVIFRDNYDGSETEPVVLPAAYPNLLVNGSEGIAVGMATSIPPHNLGEIISATIAYIQNNSITTDELMEYVKAPDFPTSALIIANGEIKRMFETGRGSIKLRARTEIEEIERGKSRIVITELPYQVVKAYLVEDIANLVKDKKVDGITDIRDESNKEGIRVVIELRKDVQPQVMLNQLFKFTQLQTNFSANVLALNNGRPELMGLKDIISHFVKFREGVILRRTNYLLNKVKNKALVVIGLTVAVDFIDEVVAIIRSSKDPSEARERLLAKKWNAVKVIDLIDLIGDKRNKVVDGFFMFTQEQVKAILDMRLAKLTGLERDSLVGELKGLAQDINYYTKILFDRQTFIDLMISELEDVKTRFAVPRRSEIIIDDSEIDIESLIQREDIVVSYTTNGYIKRDMLKAYNTQKRGGKGKFGMKTGDDEVISDIFTATTHSRVLFFTNKGRVYELKGYKIPEGNAQSKGRAIVNLLNLQQDEFVKNFLPINEKFDSDSEGGVFLIFATKNGTVKKSSFEDFVNINTNGKIAIGLDDNDELVSVKIAKEEDHILMSTFCGQSVRFEVASLRTIKGRGAFGVRGVSLDRNDKVISLDIIYGVREAPEVRDEYLKLPLELRKNIAKGDANLDLVAAMSKKQISLSEDVVYTLAKNEQFIFSITESGYGKKTSAYEYRVTNRGGKGVKNISTSGKNGGVVASFVTEDRDDIILVSTSGKVIRCSAAQISTFGRSARGVKIMFNEGGEVVSSVTKVAGTDDVDTIDAVEIAELGLHAPSVADDEVLV